MAFYNLTFKSSAAKDIALLPKSVISRILVRLEHLKGNPLPSQSRKLQGAERLYRLRVGDYRVVYEVDSLALQITIHHIRHRRDIYRHLN